MQILTQVTLWLEGGSHLGHNLFVISISYRSHGSCWAKKATTLRQELEPKQVGREARQVGCLGDVQKAAVTHSAYGSTAQRSILGLPALYIKW